MKTIQTYAPAETDGILLNANENSFPLSETIRAEILDAVASVALNRYPDSDETELLEAYGKLIHVSPSQLLAGNGSDQMLGYMIGTFLGKGKVLATLNPDFSMYDYYASSYEADVVKFRIEDDGSFSPEEFAAFARENRADLILFSNPNNPSGHCLAKQEIAVIAEALAPVPVIIDEAYIDFADQESCLPLIETYDNLYITRTLSKAFGLAAIRTGFLISCEKNMKPLKQSFVPYALNSVSMKIAGTVLKHADVYFQQIETIKAQRAAVYEAMKANTKLTVYPSEANFLYGASARKDRLLAILKERGITIRDYAGTDRFRITIGTEQENELVLSALKAFEEEL